MVAVAIRTSGFFFGIRAVFTDHKISSTVHRLNILGREYWLFSRVLIFLRSSSKIITFQVLVIDYKLTYPSVTATAVLINGFHTPQGDKNAK